MKTTVLLTVNGILMLLLLVMVCLVYIQLMEEGAATLQSATPIVSEQPINSSIEELRSEAISEKEVVLSDALRELIGYEIRDQLAISFRELTETQLKSVDQEQHADDAATVLTEQQQYYYQRSKQLLDDVVNGAIWTQDVNQQFEADLAQLPGRESFELARLQASLISQGLIDPSSQMAGEVQE